MVASPGETVHGESPELPSDTRSPSTRELVIRGWASVAAVCVATTIFLEAVSGLWLYLAPFSDLSQVLVLFHVSAGVLLLAPALYYLVWHFLAWRAQKQTVISIMGYALSLVVAVCAISGIVLTIQASVGPKLSPLWDQVHLVSGILTGSLVATHLLLAFWRRRVAARQDAALVASWKLFARRGLAGATGAALLVVGGVIAWRTPDWEQDLPEGYRLSQYVQQFDEYRGSPFAPSYARTANGKLVKSNILAGSSSCGTAGCHEQILAEWEPSASLLGHESPLPTDPEEFCPGARPGRDAVLRRLPRSDLIVRRCQGHPQSLVVRSGNAGRNLLRCLP